jgi:beta-lactamase regulating signal transducer with metallopeptidase domain
VLLKLLTPPMWRVDAGAFLPERPARTEPAGLLDSEIVAAAGLAADSERAGEIVPADSADGESVATVPSRPLPGAREDVLSKPSVAAPRIAPRGVSAAVSDRWVTWVIVVTWVSGSLVCAVVIVGRVVRFRRLLRYAEPAPYTVQKLAAVLGRRLGLVDAQRVYFAPGAICPMLWAVGGPPRVLVPRDLWGRLTARQRSSLLAHELAHLRRGDPWVRIIELLVVVAYWWFPVAWWARRRLREAEEQCCDAWVVWALPGSGRAYAGAILEAVEFVSVRSRVPLLASGMGQFASLKRRFAMIRTESVPRTLSWYGRVTVAALAGVLLPLAPSRAQPASDGPTAAVKEPSPPVPAVAPVTVAAPVGPEVKIAADERAVIADLAVGLDEASDANASDKDKAKARAEKDRARVEKDKANEEKARIKAYKDARESAAKIDADQKAARKEEKDGDDDNDDLAEARAEVRELSKQLEKASQRLAKLEAKRHAGHAEGHAPRAGASAAPPTQFVPPTPGQPGVPQPYAAKPMPPQPPGEFARGGKWPDMAATERAREHRLAAIEERLRAIMKEVEAIRREKDAAPQPGKQ